MNLEVRKLNFIQEFIQLQNEDIFKGLEKVLFESKVNLIETNISPMSLLDIICTKQTQRYFRLL